MFFQKVAVAWAKVFNKDISQYVEKFTPSSFSH